MYLTLFLIALVVSSIGFYKFVYFISLGYGFSIAVMAGALLLSQYQHLTSLTLLLCIMLIIYGCRLGGYLLLRELKSAQYRQTMKKEIKDGSQMKLFVKVCIWISCALLYVCQITPIVDRLIQQKNESLFGIIGLIIMICGMSLEAIADYQKSKSKQKYSHCFCDSGVYKIVRCPNYLGEVIFWTGVFVSSFPIVSKVAFIFGFIGYGCIVYIMFGGARRLEIRQNKNYGKDKEYQEYVKKTPILLPFIPLYSVEKYKWLVG